MVQLSLALISILLLFTGCVGERSRALAPPPPSRPEPVLATLGPLSLHESDFQQFLEAAYPPEQVLEARQHPAARQEALEAYLDLQVMAAKARKDGLDQLVTFRKAQELMQMKVLVSRLNQRERQRAEQGEKASPVPIETLRREMGLKQTPLATTNVPLLNAAAIPPDAVLATLGGVPLTEADFQWFLKDAFRREQRLSVFSRPEARPQLLASFFDMRVLEAKARKEGLDKTPEYQREYALMETRLLVEFLQERDGTAPWKLPGATEQARLEALKAYTSRLRAEMALKLSAASGNRAPQPEARSGDSLSPQVSTSGTSRDQLSPPLKPQPAAPVPASSPL